MEKETGVPVFIPTKKWVGREHKLLNIGNSHALVIPKMWVEMYASTDADENFWVSLTIEGDIITIKPL